MEALNNTRLRLRHELQRAYDAWMESTTRRPRAAPGMPAAMPRVPGAVTPQWLEYLAAKQRLVRAYADMLPAG